MSRALPGLAAPPRPAFPAAPRAAEPLLPWAGPALVAAAVLFNAAFCFVNTRGWAAVGSLPIIAASLGLTGAALLLARHRVGPGLARAAVLVATTVAALKLLNEGLDLKILFDLLVPPAFFLLGTRCPERTALRLLLLLMAAVIPFGFFELLLPDAFSASFNILDFYTSKGTVAADAVNYSGTSFFFSAQRSEEAGRTLLPFLFGQHRVSSVFLEPVSMGNFPLVCLCWLLATWRGATPARLLLAGCIALCIVLPDSRQAAAASVLLLLLRLSPLRGSPALTLAMPPLALAGLFVLGTISLRPGEVPAIDADDFTGRLLFSGRLLAFWDGPEWLALSPSPVYTADTGYAYLVNNLSLPLLLYAWLAGLGRAAPNRRAPFMRCAVSLYVTTSLCIGASLVSIKTAALLWFLLGSVEAGSDAGSDAASDAAAGAGEDRAAPAPT